MTKSLHYLLICLIPLFLVSCGDCEDKTKRVDANYLAWFPYEEATSVSYTNENMETITYTLTPDEHINTDEIGGGDCTLTTVLNQIKLGTEEQETRINLWFSKTDELVGNDRNQLWGILDGADDSLEASGSLTNINNIESELTTLTLSGNTYNEILSLTLSNSNEEVMTVYLQKDIGLVAYDYQEETWILDE